MQNPTRCWQTNPVSVSLDTHVALIRYIISTSEDTHALFAAPGWRTVTCCDIMLDCPIGSILCVCHMTVMTTAAYKGK